MRSGWISFVIAEVLCPSGLALGLKSPYKLRAPFGGGTITVDHFLATLPSAEAPQVAVHRNFIDPGRSEVLQIGGEIRLSARASAAPNQTYDTLHVSNGTAAYLEHF
eukprot:scaffold2066_cov63-Phaeocystis_antarctica.AAC.4